MWLSVSVMCYCGGWVGRVLHSESDLIDHWGRMLKLLFVNYPATLSWFDPDLPWFHVCQVSVGRDSPLEVLFTIFPVTVLILQQISAGPVRLLKENIFSVCPPTPWFPSTHYPPVALPLAQFCPTPTRTHSATWATIHWPCPSVAVPKLLFSKPLMIKFSRVQV